MEEGRRVKRSTGSAQRLLTAESEGIGRVSSCIAEESHGKARGVEGVRTTSCKWMRCAHLDGRDVIPLHHVAPERGLASRVLLEAFGHKRVKADDRVEAVDLAAQSALANGGAIAHEQHAAERLHRCLRCSHCQQFRTLRSHSASVESGTRLQQAHRLRRAAGAGRRDWCGRQRRWLRQLQPEIIWRVASALRRHWRAQWRRAEVPLHRWHVHRQPCAASQGCVSPAVRTA